MTARSDDDDVMTPKNRFERAVYFAGQANNFANRGKDNAAISYIAASLTALAEGLRLKEVEREG